MKTIRRADARSDSVGAAKMTLDVTFDSNVWECIVDPEKRDAHADANALNRIRSAIESGVVRPFISDVVVTLEGVRRRDRASVFRDIEISSTSTHSVAPPSPDGPATVSRTITRRTSFDHFPSAHEKLSRSLHEAVTLGFKMIRVPPIGWMRLEEAWYKPTPADEGQLSDLLHRTNVAAVSFEEQGCGVAWVTELGEEALRIHPELTQRGIQSPFLAFAYGDNQAAIPDAVAEWADGDALAAHYGHGHDVFCSLDRGRQAGSRSILQGSRRTWLMREFGIKVSSPIELSELFS